MLDLGISFETGAAALSAARRTEVQIEEMRWAPNSFNASLDSAEETAAPIFQFHLQIAFSVRTWCLGVLNLAASRCADL